LERINPFDDCKGDDNWIASIDTVFGGTPGKQNSIFSDSKDILGPKLLSVSQMDSVTIQIIYDETLQQSLPTTSEIKLDPILTVTAVAFVDETKKSISVSFGGEIKTGKTYSVNISNVHDCAGNIILDLNSGGFLNLDTIAPIVENVNLVSNMEVEILFNERLEPSSANDNSNYLISTETNYVSSAELMVDEKMVKLKFEKQLSNGNGQSLLIKNLKDVNGNVITQTTTSILFFEPLPVSHKDVIITEIFPDPSPSIGLPENEFIEIYNRSSNPIQLKDWSITDGSAVAHLRWHILLPDNYLILCSTSSGSQFAQFGNSQALASFPSLNNTSDMLVLKNSEGVVIDSLNYTDSWYVDEDKGEGGYTLEIIDPQNICAEEENWLASENETGGTPGKSNSVLASKPDVEGPLLLSAIATGENILLLTFNEKLQKQLPLKSDFVVEGFSIAQVKSADQQLKKFQLAITPPFSKSTQYTVIAKNIYDCAGNVISSEHNKITFAMPELPEKNDIVINEILFNPTSTGDDFVEIYNNSSKYINLKELYLANIEGDTIVNKKQILNEDYLFEPKRYVALTLHSDRLKGEYIQGIEENFLEIASMPSMNDDEGSIALVDSLGNKIDFFQYNDKQHSVFIKDTEGVSLERVDMTIPASQSGNWKSSSEASGFATPGYLNSNSVAAASADAGSVLVEPQAFEPITGQPDFAKINYNFDKGGFIANVKIFDPHGRQIKVLASNEVLGTKGFFRWDGDQDNGAKANVGSYMIWFQIFDDQGKVQIIKKPVVIASKF
jgi:hypothetical protein